MKPSAFLFEFAAVNQAGNFSRIKALLAVATLSLGSYVSASADVAIDDNYTPVNLSTMPGSATDFTLFGDPSQFPSLNNNNSGGFGDQPTILDDFGIAAGADATNTYGGNSAVYSVINAPTGSGDTGVTTGILYKGGASAPDLVDFTLGKQGSTFDFSSFNVYVMYGNAHDGYEKDTSIDISVLPPASSPDQTPLVTPITLASTDGNTDLSAATFQEFTITGASAGDVLQIGAGSWGYLGGVSFSEAPEPRTYLLIAAGMLVMLCTRRSLRRN